MTCGGGHYDSKYGWPTHEGVGTCAALRTRTSAQITLLAHTNPPRFTDIWALGLQSEQNNRINFSISQKDNPGSTTPVPLPLNCVAGSGRLEHAGQRRVDDQPTIVNESGWVIPAGNVPIPVHG